MSDAPVVAFEGTRTTLPTPTSPLSRFARREGWTLGVALLFVLLLGWRISQVPQFGHFEVRTITAGTMPLAFLAMAQSIIVIGGGIDLSVGAQMVFANCLSALWMEGHGFGACLGIAVAVLAVNVLLAAAIGGIITVSGVPDIIVTLAASFTISGLALFIIGGPGGGASIDFQHFVAGPLDNFWPSVLWTIGALVLVWLPLRLSRTGLAIYATGSNRNAAFLSGVSIARTRVTAYAFGGLFAGFAGLVITALDGRRRTAGDHRGQRHPQRRGRRRARRGGPHRWRRRAGRPGAGRDVPHDDPGDHARPRLGPEQRRDGARRDHHPRRPRRRPAPGPSEEDVIRRG